MNHATTPCRDLRSTSTGYSFTTPPPSPATSLQGSRRGSISSIGRLVIVKLKGREVQNKPNCSASSLQRPVALSNAASSPSPQLPRPRPTLQRSLSHASDRVRFLTLSCAGFMVPGSLNASYPSSRTPHLTWLQERSRRLSGFSLRSETAANQPDFHSEEFERSVEGGF